MVACSNDSNDFGTSFGPDSLVIPLLSKNSRRATSKLGPYFEKGPDDLNSLFGKGVGGTCTLSTLQVYSGVYEDGEDIPYSGGVLDMTSG